ncbi:response regulator transcription factor [Geothermobacter ehrlichii]|nr:helix-turn-helix transcriptional regulator [Geothermobacter ehrlichii]
MKKLRPLLSFSAIVFWLLSWPLQGPLLRGGPPETQLFLAAHTIALILTAVILDRGRLRRLQPLALLGAIVATAGYRLTTTGAAGWLLFAGICGALLMVQAGCVLSGERAPLRQAAMALLIANLALFLLIRIDSSVLQTTLVLLLLPLAAGKNEQPPQGQQRDLPYYLPLLICYHLVAGLMYAQMLPNYQQAAWWPGAELFCYLAMVATALKIRTEHGDLRLVAAFLTATVALVLHGIGGRTGANLALFAMQAAAGLIDVFVLELMLTQRNPVTAFGYGCAAVTGGIFTGEWLGELLSSQTGLVSMAGILALNLTLVLLYLLGRHHGSRATSPNSVKRQLFTAWQPAPVTSREIPSEWRVLLAPKEQQTLLGVMAGLTYREIAEEMAVSSSTVKTYMQRIYVKTGCSCQKDLLRHVATLQSKQQDKNRPATTIIDRLVTGLRSFGKARNN